MSPPCAVRPCLRFHLTARMRLEALPTSSQVSSRPFGTCEPSQPMSHTRRKPAIQTNGASAPIELSLANVSSDLHQRASRASLRKKEHQRTVAVASGSSEKVQDSLYQSAPSRRRTEARAHPQQVSARPQAADFDLKRKLPSTAQLAALAVENKERSSARLMMPARAL